MKYAILALGLLTVPARAATWTHDDCEVIGDFFDSASKEARIDGLPDKCEIPISVGWRGIMPVLGPVADRHHISIQKMNEVGHQVCLGNLTALQATRQFCPGYRPKP
ncbi:MULTISPECIES: hypothetical protein [unclassified Bradyrhizobium]|uniref:hypothetical protein n=1 Tax=unclassified Bradyrhizobium TaxID=2631580 RepID=UPI001FF78CAD|nr:MULTISPECIES: hypothetical protein [unclassified Bradyrhizobium]MCK1271572.1 hypothetical protein [Bradyrhizobium sp. 84]MCK1373899.1 hypothetical protein [Bradyrhizobium sp. 49]MCK1416796.1 hypothetical protein [Bradyrhizobium sp. CW4]MCK1427777.1 hypothetical protein [Bradyrhizobium sp. 87]